MINLIFFVLLVLALAGIFILFKSNRKQEQLIKKETESIKQLRDGKTETI